MGQPSRITDPVTFRFIGNILATDRLPARNGQPLQTPVHQGFGFLLGTLERSAGQRPPLNSLVSVPPCPARRPIWVLYLSHGTRQVPLDRAASTKNDCNSHFSNSDGEEPKTKTGWWSQSGKKTAESERRDRTSGSDFRRTTGALISRGRSGGSWPVSARCPSDPRESRANGHAAIPRFQRNQNEAKGGRLESAGAGGVTAESVTSG